MVFNDTTNASGIIQTIEYLCDFSPATISGDATKLKQFTASINQAQHNVRHLIFLTTGNWEYDGGNHIDLPSATTSLDAGVKRYLMPPDALTMQRLEIKDINGNLSRLKPISKELIKGSLDEFMKEPGTPTYYRLVDNTIELFPAPNYTQADSLKMYFDRADTDFLTSDTIKTPGFASLYHKIIPIKASIEWFKIKQPQSQTLAILLQDELKLQKEIVEFYSRRFKDYKPRISRQVENYK